MDGVRRLLKDDGIVLIKTDNMANPYVGLSGRYMDMTHEFCFTEISLRQALRATGFKDINIIGTDIYVLNPIISVVAKTVAKLSYLFLYLQTALYGRTSIKIFEKDILAIAKK